MIIDALCTIGIIIAVLFGISLLAAIALTIALGAEIKRERSSDSLQDRSEK